MENIEFLDYLTSNKFILTETKFNAVDLKDPGVNAKKDGMLRYTTKFTRPDEYTEDTKSSEVSQLIPKSP